MIPWLIAGVVLYFAVRDYGWNGAALVLGIYGAALFALRALQQSARRKQAVRLLRKPLSEEEKLHLQEVQATQLARTQKPSPH
jgi:hypothetical protein